MPINEFKVVHVSPRVQAHGGIEALHALHRTLPLTQAFVALFDRRPEERAGYFNLNFTWRTTLGEMRRKFAEALAPHAGSVVVYHNAWGLPLLCPGDGAARRIAFCHAMPAFHAPDLPAGAGLIDGLLGVTPALSEAWRKWLPGIEPQRTCILPLPVSPPGEGETRRLRGEIVIGYAGRVVREHKRLDRLHDFLQALERTGVRHRFEVIGDGELRPELQRRLGARVRFHGWVPKDEFWRVLTKWDAVVFFTEVEGGPIAMLEGMAMGAIPFYPRIGGSVGDVYAPQVDPLCHYPPGDLIELAASVQRVFARTPEAIEAMRERARRLVAGHRPERYAESLIGHLQRIAALSRISRADGGASRGGWTDKLPLGFVTRAARGLLRRF